MKKAIAISPEPRVFSDDEVPKGWKLATILDACEVNPPKPSKDFLPADAPVTFVPMPAVDADMGAITNPEIKPYLEVRNGFTSFRDGDVIMAKITPCMENGKAAIVHGMKNGIGFGSTEFHVMRSRGEILPEYLYYYIRQKSFRNEAESHFTGSVGQKRVPADFIKQSVIPLPPLTEQQRIVARVEALLTYVNASRDRLSRMPLIMKKFRQGVLAAACSGRLTEGWREENPDIENASLLVEKIIKSHKNDVKAFGGKAGTSTEGVHDISEVDIPDSWTICELKYLSKPGKPITYGILKPGQDIPNGIPYIRVVDFPNNKLNLKTIRHTTPEIAANYKRSTLSGNDLLLSIRGTVGRVCQIPLELNGGNITQDSVRISVHDSISRKYIELYLQTPSVQKRFESAIKGVAIRGVNVGDVRVLQVVLPPLTEQHEIVRRVNALFERADAIEREVNGASRRTEALTHAILAKAFRGELVVREAELTKRV